ncbi:hypothetical protein L249_7510 [Ophiocordyceps polyrhachis-furcata BCC 54312]|uniref:Centrosomin N-terminal motif 1 domain-containing protein n=1 Tax=Ophiocordyceps polyrhachis-furcata BCC 54312 TaxID=1330021 RepID=A0A367LB25_9HYPO|nr:hypothetical protein L249_7510 [Ophiocordyceps polyrhachis-furcata BCC 54312]
MVQPGFGGALDTPRTVADATFLSRPPDFPDVSQEASFQSPRRDAENNLLRHLGAGGRRGIDPATPRQQRGKPLADRRNLPPSVGGAEFTPLLKSATRNSARRLGKENAVAAVRGSPDLDRIDEVEVTPIPRGDTSVYAGSRGSHSFLDKTTLPQVDSSSVASTPLARRPSKDRGPLQDGNQLSLREQENVIDRIEKENFGLKLKIHFLEDALRKAGPGYSEAALKENTELKVDKVTMQRELHRYKKQLTSAERDLEKYRQQMLDLQDKAKRKQPDDSQLRQLQKTLKERESDLDNLQRQVDRGQHHRETELETLKDTVEDLEADLREKDRIITSREDELEDLREKLQEAEEKARNSQQQQQDTDEVLQDELDQAQETIERLQQDTRRLEEQADDSMDKMKAAVAQRQRAEEELRILREDLADKSIVTKGLSRQLEDRVVRLQEELDKSGEEYAGLEKELARANGEIAQLRAGLKSRDHDSDLRMQELEAELLAVGDERDELQSQNEALGADFDSLRLEADRLEKKVQDMETRLAQERELALERERDLRSQYDGEMARLNDEISDLQAEVREKDNLYDNDSDKWETQRQTLESERDRAEEKAAGLQRTIDRLRSAEGSLSDKESKLKAAMESEGERHRSEAAMMNRQMDELKEALEARQTLLTSIRSELSSVREELRQTQIDYQAQVNKAVGLEDEVEVLQAASQDLEAARLESDRLRSELQRQQQQQQQQQQQRGSSPSSESTARLASQLSEATRQLDRANKDKQTLQDQLTKLKADLTTARDSLAEAEAERDELEQRAQNQDQDTGLRTAKMRLDGELRRLKEENKRLVSQRDALESSLEEELDKAAASEERVAQLEDQLRQSSNKENQELAGARRSIRDLERRIAERETQQQQEDDGSRLRLDLSAARKKEVQLLQRESSHRDAVKGLKKQLTELERRLHEKDVSRLMRQDDESQLRQRLDEAEDQRQVLEEVLDEARHQAEAAAAQHQQALGRLLSEAEQKQTLVQGLVEAEASLRRKLERARSERAAYRLSAERLSQRLRQSPSSAPATMTDETAVKERRGMVMQMEWMQARWEREATLRSDAAYAKAFVQLELAVAQACNKAQLRELDDIRTRLAVTGRGKQAPPMLPISSSPSPSRLRSLLLAVRFVVRARIAARSWARHEVVRRRLVAAFRDGHHRRLES